MTYEPDNATLINGWYETLLEVLPPKSVSDRTYYRNLRHWLRERLDLGLIDRATLQEVLLYAKESKLPGCRNPRAVFCSTLKKELGYRPATERKAGERP